MFHETLFTKAYMPKWTEGKSTREDIDPRITSEYTKMFTYKKTEIISTSNN